MTVINYVIRIPLSDNSDTDTDWGLYSGVFKWATGRPDFGGDPGDYSGEYDDEYGDEIIKNGIITSEKKMGSMVRIASGIEVSGGYGGLSGFTFEIDNTSKFWEFLQSNDYYLINRNIDVYIFLDTVSYHVWGGVISEVNYSETVYKFTCEDDFKIVHKATPPDIASDRIFPTINSKAESEPIPICFGNIKKAKFLPIVSKQKSDVTSSLDITRTITPAKSINAGTFEIVLYTSGVEFGSNELKDKFIKAVINGGHQSIQIASNTATDTEADALFNTTTLLLTTWFSSTPEVLGDSPLTNNATDIWYFEITEFKTAHIVSNNSIDSFVDADDGSGANLDFWNSDENDYSSIINALVESSTSDIAKTGYPGIQVYSKNINMEGTLSNIYPIQVDDVKYRLASLSGGTYTSDNFVAYPDDNPQLHDKNGSNGYNIVATSNSGSMVLLIDLTVNIPKQLLDVSYDKIYIVFDFDLLSVKGSTQFIYSYGISGIDFMGRDTDLFLEEGFLFSSGGGSSSLDANLPVNDTVSFPLIPKVYYDEASDDTVFNSKRSVLDLSSFIANNKSIEAFPSFKIRSGYRVNAASGNVVTLTMKEIAMVGRIDINLINDDLYSKIKGESVG